MTGKTNCKHNLIFHRNTVNRAVPDILCRYQSIHIWRKKKLSIAHCRKPGGVTTNYLLVNKKTQLDRAEAQPDLGSYLAVRQSCARLAPKTDNPRFSGLTFTKGVQAPVKRQEPPHLRQVSLGEKEEEKRWKVKTSLHEAGSLRRLCLVFLGRFMACNLTGRDRWRHASRRVSCCIFDGRSWRSASALLQSPLPF